MGCVSSSIKRTDECVGTDDSCDENICSEVHSKPLKNQHHDHTSPKTSKHISNASVITPSKSRKTKSSIHSLNISNTRPRSSKSEIPSPKINASAEIIAGPVISSIKGADNFKEFDLDYLENNHFPNNPYLPSYQNFNHENIQGIRNAPQLKSNRDILRPYYPSSSSLGKQRSMEVPKDLKTIPEHYSLQHEPLPSTSGSSSSSSPGFVPSVSQSHELAYEPLRLAPDIENEDMVELSYIRSAVEWRNQHKGKVNMETQLKKRRVEMVCNGAFLQFNEKALKYEIICIDSSLPGLRMPSSESEKSSETGSSNKAASLSKPSKISDETNDEPKSSIPAKEPFHSGQLEPAAHESNDDTPTISSNDLTRKSSEGKLKEHTNSSPNTSNENKESSSLPSHVPEVPNAYSTSSPSNYIKDVNIPSDEIKKSISVDTPTQSINDLSKIKPITPSTLSSISDSRKSKGRIIRPDLIIRDLKTNIIVHVEIDEHKHRGYNITNEEIRAKTIAEYFSSKGFKYKRLNFNPNGFDNRIEMAHSFVDFVNCYKGICGVYSIDC